MNPLTTAVENYLDLRRGLGFKLREYGECLHEFVSFLAERGAGHITCTLAVEYSCRRSYEKEVSWARRLGIIRGFAEYRSAIDPATEVPHQRLLPFRSKRARPYLYTQDEIARLLRAARTMVSPHPLRQRTHYCLFGLLAVTGMRLGEALSLRPEDVDLNQGIITVRRTKFDKNRLVPLHPSTCAVLRAYARLRDKTHARRGRVAAFFFAAIHGTRLSNTNVNLVFRTLSRQIGLRKPGGGPGPRLHDFRHRFAVESLLCWYRSGEDVTRRMPVLSTYLGHGNVSGTYWYLTNTPELMSAASGLLEARWKGVAR
ncbi:MAG: tyrosine-type recombinase/integrase [Gemmatimonadaceae bacterium]|nr:tyrosine-type recombinase/integrase [Gemmatimonadaceae bacterium]